MQPLVQGLLFGGLAVAMAMGALPHSPSRNTSAPNEKRVSLTVPVQAAKVAPGTLSQAQVIPQRVSTSAAINQYHIQVIDPPPGWQTHIPCLRPPASFRADMPMLEPQGILGTNRTAVPSARIIMRPR